MKEYYFLRGEIGIVFNVKTTYNKQQQRQLSDTSTHVEAADVRTCCRTAAALVHRRFLSAATLLFWQLFPAKAQSVEMRNKEEGIR